MDVGAWDEAETLQLGQPIGPKSGDEKLLFFLLEDSHGVVGDVMSILAGVEGEAIPPGKVL